MKKVKRVIGIKCFNPDLKCRDFQYEIGKTYEIQGELKMCHNGFHFYHHSQLENVFKYYYPAEARYCLVVGEDVIMDNDKSVARKITIIKEHTLLEVIDIRIGEMDKLGITEKQDEDYGLAGQTGYRGSAHQTGFHGISGQTGYQGLAHQTGFHGISGQTGYQGLAYQTGYRGSATQTGDRGVVTQTGYQGLASQTGDRGLAIQDGEYGVAISMSIEGRAMVKNDKGAIVIQNWIKNNYGYCCVKNGLYARVGDTLPNGEVMATNTWYWYENGELKSLKNKI